jgi:hypothetical protein
MPMPIDVQFTKKDGTVETHTIPLNLMYAVKTKDDAAKLIVHEEWRWTHPTYILETKTSLREFTEIEIDATQRMADVDRRNNLIELKW